MSDNSDIKKKVLEALEKCLGVVTDACKMANISRQTFYRWKHEDNEFKEAVHEISDVALDFAESKLFRLIDGVHREVKSPTGESVVYQEPPNPSATIFYLKTKGKKRGYIERQEMDHRGKTVIEVGLPPIDHIDQSNS